MRVVLGHHVCDLCYCSKEQGKLRQWLGQGWHGGVQN